MCLTDSGSFAFTRLEISKQIYYISTTKGITLFKINKDEEQRKLFRLVINKTKESLGGGTFSLVEF